MDDAPENHMIPPHGNALDDSVLQHLRRALQGEKQLNLSLDGGKSSSLIGDDYTQLTLDFECRTAQGRADFVVSDCNRRAVNVIDRYPNWQGAGVVLVGDEHCGKTHLCHVWASKTQALWLHPRDFLLSKRGGDAPWIEKVGMEKVGIENKGGAKVAMQHMPQKIGDDVPRIIVDDAHTIPDFEQLFHLYNWVVNRGGHLLLTARDYPKMWNIGVPDVLSRVQALNTIPIENPDDMMIVLMMVKLFNDRQVRVAPDVLFYIVKRLPRRYNSVVAFVDYADKLAVTLNQPITIPLAKKIFKHYDIF